MTVIAEREHVKSGRGRTVRYVVRIERDRHQSTVATFEQRPGDEPRRARRLAKGCAVRLAHTLDCSALVTA